MLVAPPQVERNPLDPRLSAFAPVGSLRASFPVTLVASTNDPYCPVGQAKTMTRRWNARLVDAGAFGHINADSGLGDWPYGKYLLRRLLLVDEQRVLRSADPGTPDSVR